MLEPFLADGPPQVREAAAGQPPADRRPVDQGPDGFGTPPTDGPPDAAPDDRPPIETAADVPVPDSGGSSFYTDDFTGVGPDPTPTNAQADLAGDPILPDSPSPTFVEQFGDPLVLSSLAAVELFGPLLDAPVPQLAPVPVETGTEIDPLAELQVAEGEGIGAPDDTAGQAFTGTAGDDALVGTDSNDTLSGGNGNDTLTGGGGDDTLTGGSGADVFSFSVAASAGDDVVTDFATGSDTLRISDLTDVDGDTDTDLADLDAGGGSVSGDSASLDLSFASGSSVSLPGVDGTGLDSFTDLTGIVEVA